MILEQLKEFVKSLSKIRVIGNTNEYDPEGKHKDVIYFDRFKKEIYLNNDTYTSTSDLKNLLNDIDILKLQLSDIFYDIYGIIGKRNGVMITFEDDKNLVYYIDNKPYTISCYKDTPFFIHVPENAQNFSFNRKDGITGISTKNTCDLSYLSTNKYTTMKMMFACLLCTELDISNFDTSNVTDMSYMFYYTGNYQNPLVLDLSHFNVSNVTDMSYMFYLVRAKSINLSGWDISNVTNFLFILDRFEGLITLSKWKWNFTEIPSLSEFFTEINQSNHYNILTYDITDGIFNSYDDMKQLILYMRGKSIIWKNLNNLPANLSDYNLFNSYTFKNIDLSNWDTSNITDMSRLFLGTTVISIKLDNWDTSNVTDMSYMFYMYGLSQEIDLSSFNTSNVSNMSHMFRSLKTINVTNFDTSNVINMNSMFSENTNLLSLDLSNFNTSNVTDMGAMFYKCSKLKTLDLSNFDTSNVINMGAMFSSYVSGQTAPYYMNIENLNISTRNTSNVTNMSQMFLGCYKLLELDLSHFDVSNVEDMSSMFRGCKSLTSLNISTWNTSKVTTLDYTFMDCSALILLDLSSFDTSNVTRLAHTFLGCSTLTSLDLSNFDTTKVTSVYGMFNGCTSLISLDLSKFDMTHLLTGTSYNTYMFKDCNNLSYIKCTEEFRDWCWTNSTSIKLPSLMLKNGTGTWEIVEKISSYE